MGYFIGLGFLALLLAILVIMKNKGIFSLGSFQWVPYLVLVAAIAGVGWNGAMFYSKPGLVHHALTVDGSELVYSGAGWRWQGYGTVNDWKRAMSVQVCKSASTQGVDNKGESAVASSELQPVTAIFLDQVDAKVCGMVRFSIPTDEVGFLKMVHEFRTPANLMRVSLEPAVAATIQATANLMTAEEYYSGKQTDFRNDFLIQLRTGIYLVDRREVVKNIVGLQAGGASPADGKKQDEYGDGKSVTYEVTKRTDANGDPLVKEQSFAPFGITVVSGDITLVDPNEKFKTRMLSKQDASAKRAVAREQRLEEIQSELLAIARGDREVAEEQAKMKVVQMRLTTTAETNRKEAVIKANMRNEEAEIDKTTAQIKLDRAEIDAKAKKVAADATAYEKKAILLADNALQIKVDAVVEVNRDWAQAFANRKVPNTVFVGSGAAGSGGAPIGNNMDASTFMQIMTMKAARDLDVDLSISAATEKDSMQ